MKFKIKIIFVSFLVVAVACDKPKTGNTSTGNPLVSLTVAGSGGVATVQYQPGSFLEWLMAPKKAWALPPPALFDSSLRAVTVSEFWLGLKNIELKTTETAGTEEASEIQLSGPFSVDLLTSSPSSLGTLAAPSEGVRRFRARLEKVETVAAGVPVELLTNSVVLKGTVSGHQFTVVLADGIDYEISGPNLVNFANGSRLLLTIHTANLFKKMDLAAINGDMTISASNRVSAVDPCPSIHASASDLYTCFQEGMKSEANTGEDVSGDHELDDSEESVK